MRKRALTLWMTVMLLLAMAPAAALADDQAQQRFTVVWEGGSVELPSV